MRRVGSARRRGDRQARRARSSRAALRVVGWLLAFALGLLGVPVAVAGLAPGASEEQPRN